MISLGLLVLGWVIYDLLCRSPITGIGFVVVGVALIAAGAYGLSLVFGGRGMYMQLGAMLGTIMAANVAMVIIPGQRKMVDAMAEGLEPDPAPGIKAKQRSLHNNYFTLPVLFVMISSHYPMTFGHAQAWLVLMALFVVGGLVRHFFNLKNQGRLVWGYPMTAILLLLGLAVWIAPRPQQLDLVSDTSSIDFSQVQVIMAQRCQACHAQNPTHPTAPIAPKGVMLESAEQIEQWADLIYQQTVETRVMPLANLTGITEEERQIVAAWYLSRN